MPWAATGAATLEREIDSCRLMGSYLDAEVVGSRAVNSSR
jgi:hypothetical protein